MELGLDVLWRRYRAASSKINLASACPEVEQRPHHHLPLSCSVQVHATGRKRKLLWFLFIAQDGFFTDISTKCMNKGHVESEKGGGQKRKSWSEVLHNQLLASQKATKVDRH